MPFVVVQPRVKATKQFVHTKVGLQAILECEVSSAPTANVYWFHRVAPIYPDSRTLTSESDMVIFSLLFCIFYFFLKI